MNVCSGKLLTLDVSSGDQRVRRFDEDLARKYFMGSGMGAYLYSELPALPEPLTPDAPLLIIPGLLTGTLAPCACRTLFCARSPLTGIWDESTAGGFFGAELRYAGWDGLILTGRAAEPSILWIQDDQVTLLPAGRVWGLETLDAGDIVRGMTDVKAQTAVIGPAGERLVPMANVMLGGHDCRAAGRGGIGAVLGSKNIKAIAVRGHGRPTYAHDAEFKALVRENNVALKEAYVGLGKLGTGGSLANAAKAGDMPVKNWAGGAWMDGAMKITGAAMADRGLIVRSYHCHACPIGCTQHLRVPSGPYAGLEGHAPEYETLAGFGGNCLNDDLDAIITANERCNRLGLDTISVSAAIAFAFEAAERGLLTPADAGGLELSWGNTATILALIEQVAAGAGLGARLGRGVRAMAAELGGDAESFAPHVKGLEVPYHDPRAETSMAANYATGNRGACHLSSLSYSAMWGTYVEGLYRPEPYSPHSDAGKGRMAAEWQNFMSAINALGICKLVCKTVINPALTARWLQTALGWEDMTPAEVVQVGERIFNLQRMIDLRLGVTGKDDVLPARLARQARPDGGSAGVIPNMDLIMAEYYETRGWDAAGIPTPDKLRQLGLQ
jgi:aldehyde:ferredoxin oxidoreductase